MLDHTHVSKPLRIARSTDGWKVYRLRTENSVYELEVQEEAGSLGRRCVVLTRLEGAGGVGETFEDSQPQLGLKSLYALSPLEWIGSRLCVGTAQTSLIQAVEFVSDRAEPSTIARLKLPRPSAPRPPPAPPPQRNRWDDFPKGHVEMAEVAASVLRSLCHGEDLFLAVRADALLERRLKLALAECRLMLEAMLRRES